MPTGNYVVQAVHASFVDHGKPESLERARRSLSVLKDLNAYKGIKSYAYRHYGLRAVRAHARKQADKLPPSSESREWLFLAGLAGHLNSNSGLRDLQEYIQTCEQHSCSNLDQAKELHAESMAMWPDKAWLENID